MYNKIRQIIRIKIYTSTFFKDSNAFLQIFPARNQFLPCTTFIYSVTKKEYVGPQLFSILSRKKRKSQQPNQPIRTNQIIKSRKMTAKNWQEAYTCIYPSELHSITNVGEFTNSFGTRVIEFAIYQDRMRLLNWIAQVEAAGVASLPRKIEVSCWWWVGGGARD